MSLSFEAAVVSDTGRYRRSNQDSAFIAPSAVGVADGVGGGPAGDVASAVLVHRFVAGGLLRLHDGEEVRRRLDMANWDIGALTRHDDALDGMATTFTGIFLHGDELLVAHVGDSRAYLLRDGDLTRCTRDDSYVQDLVDAGLVTADDAAHHPRRNLVTASFGGAPTDAARLTVSRHAATAGERWMLCSDGVSDYLPENEIAAILRWGHPEQAAQALVHGALDTGSRDNVTAVVADVVARSPLQDDRRPNSARGSVAFAGAAGELFQEELA
ncbi:PP2C family protein-serine/threonine phosphatase [Microbacterium sp. DT81.1]|uniref:PP2C family protein-serine/threonine phosphatase n=1 Tax=Microbacterium sp. DT81.1 TaxID=3393413 RepID=UPI003CF4B5B0